MAKPPTDWKGAFGILAVTAAMLLWFWGVGYVNCADHIGGANCFVV